MKGKFWAYECERRAAHYKEIAMKKSQRIGKLWEHEEVERARRLVSKCISLLGLL